MSKKKISNDFTFLTKYFLPYAFIMVQIVFLYVLISNKVYLFIPIILIFFVLAIYNMKHLIFLKQVYICDEGLIIKEKRKEEKVLWSEIEEFRKMKKSNNIKVCCKNKKTYIFLPQLDFIVSSSKLESFIGFLNEKSNNDS